MEKSEIRKLGEWISQMSWESMPSQVQEAVQLRVLDLVSAALGAVKDPLMEQVINSYSRRYEPGPCSVWGRTERFPAEVAAKINAMLAHTLELDDVHPASKTHGSASIIPAAWAMAQYLGKSGKDFLTAVVCGYETTARIGMALGVTAHRALGLFRRRGQLQGAPSGTLCCLRTGCGVFGCCRDDGAGAYFRCRGWRAVKSHVRWI